MANMNDNFEKLWSTLENDDDGKDLLKDIMGAIDALTATMQLTFSYKINTVNIIQEFVNIEKTLYTDFDKALSDLHNDSTTMSAKEMSILDDAFETEFTAFTETNHDRLVMVVGTAMVNERTAWRKVPGAFKEIGDTPLSLERIVNAAKDLHAATEFCQEKARKIISSLSGDDDARKFDKDLINFVLTAFKDEHE